MRRKVLALVLVLVTFSTGCNSAWLTTLQNDLPALIQAAINIAQLVAVFGAQPANPADIAAVQTISTAAQNDLNLINGAVALYKADASASNKQKIIDQEQYLQTNLAQVLSAAFIKDPTVRARVTAAVNVIISTAISLETSLGVTPTAAAPTTAQARVLFNKPPKRKDIVAAWNSTVAAPTDTTTDTSAIQLK